MSSGGFSSLQWYLSRLRAMSPAEMLAHAQRKVKQWEDRNGFSSHHNLGERTGFPPLPPAANAPIALIDGLTRDRKQILDGTWTAFGYLPLQIGGPLNWHRDYLAGVDCSSDELAFRLNHRSLPKGADVKLIWELSRWHAPVRLAMAAYILNDPETAYAALRLLERWIKDNRPFRGWNWTSALESGFRLIQYTWIDACASSFAQMHHIQTRLLPPHVWYTWRYRSVGSSANNHLLGELCGLAVAIARWPELSRFCVRPQTLHQLFQREILNQFAADGGNKEQALNYQLFSFEFAWLARAAFLNLGLPFSEEVNQRLASAAHFFSVVQKRGERWDYGDSDDAFVFPGIAQPNRVVDEWLDWFQGTEDSALHYWLDSPPPAPGQKPESTPARGWTHFPESGIATYSDEHWFLRWDLSPLGYLATGAHGHLDALHLTLWFHDICFVIDPGTGAYYADKPLRNQLASRGAHNGPALVGGVYPTRLGPFLWKEHHPNPSLSVNAEVLHGQVNWPKLALHRWIRPVHQGWRIEDRAGDGTVPFTVHWKFPPGTKISQPQPRTFLLERWGKQLLMEVDDAWSNAELRTKPSEEPNLSDVVSPHFRQTTFGPSLTLSFKGHKTCLLGVAFIACETS